MLCLSWYIYLTLRDHFTANVFIKWWKPTVKLDILINSNMSFKISVSLQVAISIQKDCKHWVQLIHLHPGKHLLLHICGPHIICYYQFCFYWFYYGMRNSLLCKHAIVSSSVLNINPLLQVYNMLTVSIKTQSSNVIL